MKINKAEFKKLIKEIILEHCDEELDEKHMGFGKLKKSLAAKGIKNSSGLAASIGRKKYGKEAMEKAAKTGTKLKDSQKKKKAQEEGVALDRAKEKHDRELANIKVKYAVEREKAREADKKAKEK